MVDGTLLGHEVGNVEGVGLVDGVVVGSLLGGLTVMMKGSGGDSS